MTTWVRFSAEVLEDLSRVANGQIACPQHIILEVHEDGTRSEREVSITVSPSDCTLMIMLPEVKP